MLHAGSNTLQGPEVSKLAHLRMCRKLDSVGVSMAVGSEAVTASCGRPWPFTDHARNFGIYGVGGVSS